MKKFRGDMGHGVLVCKECAVGDPGIGGGWWQVICFAVVLALWEAQNGIVFENTDMQIMGIVESVKIKSWNWLRVRKKGFAYFMGSWF
ncbi:hypothetical protein JHK85_013940 [Glycine max]|nr:hypothetical protein JHK85_013940 [Glycine max]